MPEFGRIEEEAIRAITSDVDVPEAPWTLNGVTAQMATFEIDAEAALDHMPGMVARPAPPYARILVLDVPDSPIGAYREALLLVSCRYLMLPRQYIAASIVTSEEAKTANARNWHYESEVGTVEFTRDGDSFVSTIRGDGALEITVTSTNAVGTAPASIRYDPIVVAQPHEGAPALFTISAEPDAVHEGWIAVGTTVSYKGGERSSPWLRLRSRNPITCTSAVQDMARPVPEEIKPMAGVGGGLP
jgi:hypothetical protein